MNGIGPMTTMTTMMTTGANHATAATRRSAGSTIMAAAWRSVPSVAGNVFGCGCLDDCSYAEELDSGYVDDTASKP